MSDPKAWAHAHLMDPATLADQTPEARLAAALLQGLKDSGYHLESEYGDAGVYDVAPAILTADPTIAADLALAAAVRDLFSCCSYHQGWDDECGQPEADPVHPTTNEQMGNDQHVFRNDWVDMKVAAAIIKAAKDK